ncbi:uncharacterized protein Eint_050660 [Encephalitozoon intestinalis ATCC 50506]|uniref:Uncharacterized protein n=1 Tax=Encephalitozoon intestinalis (strain ATCC 50506) TaxID=876142 RepID=E0S786_ENCIT|nr:uncharacterized protein Eint_050660 [Encephalitozoon intestinalis ATCC 50506]ADM11514.1 hypothetical protein Eint_050660 [Encephalitozoon intestinalis ATCC 50506]UTX45227.1 hypothetical protein GPK93_05g07720 [Encephalitozoon intestinalis]
MRRMSKSYDVIQIPGSIKHSDLPERMEIGKPFEINGDLYICEKRGEGMMKVCSESEGRTSTPVLSRGFYVVRRM